MNFAGKGVTSHGGVVLVARGMEAFGLRQSLKRFATEFSPGLLHSTEQILEQLIVLRLMGGEAMSDTRMMGESALRSLFGWPSLAHPTTFGRRLQGFPYQSNMALQEMVDGLCRQTQMAGPRLITIDSIVSTASGQSTEGAHIGYNPHKPGRPSYHPILAVDVRARSVVDGFFRPGDVGRGNWLVGFINKIVSETNRSCPLTTDILLSDHFVLKGQRADVPVCTVPPGPVVVNSMYSNTTLRMASRVAKSSPWIVSTFSVWKKF